MTENKVIWRGYPDNTREQLDRMCIKILEAQTIDDVLAEASGKRRRKKAG